MASSSACSKLWHSFEWVTEALLFAQWMLGNLGRAGYGATLEGTWPYACEYKAST